MAKSEAKKRKRKEKKLAAKLNAVARGHMILAEAKKGGYVPNPAKKFVGQGDYSMLKAKLRGRGDYLEDVANGGAQLVGKGIRYVGEKALGWLSGAAKGLLGSLLGSGDYTASGHPRANSMSSTTSAMPMVESTRGRGNIIRNTEMIASIFAHDTLQTTEWHISPGLVNTFPWLHPTGDMYQEWRMNGGVVTYVPTVAPLDDAAGGDLVINVEYDLEAPFPTTIQEVTGSYLAVAGRPLDRMVMAIECAPHETPYNVYLTRTTEVLDAPHFPYDLGKLRVTVANQPTSSNGKLLGRLYFTYEMEFFKPMVRSIPLTLPMMSWSNTSSIASTSPFTSTAAAWDGALDPASTIKPTWISGTKIQLPSFVQSGKWLFNYNCTGSGTGVAFTDGTITLTDANLVLDYYDSTGTATNKFTATTGTVLQLPQNIQFIFEVTAPSPTIALTGFTWDSGVVALFTITPVDADVLALNRALRVNRDFYDRKTREAASLQRLVQRTVDLQLLQWDEEKRFRQANVPTYNPHLARGLRLKSEVGGSQFGDVVLATHYEEGDQDDEKSSGPRVVALPNVRRRDPSPAGVIVNQK